MPGIGVVGSGKDLLKNISKNPPYQGHGKPSAFSPMILLINKKGQIYQCSYGKYQCSCDVINKPCDVINKPCDVINKPCDTLIQHKNNTILMIV